MSVFYLKLEWMRITQVINALFWRKGKTFVSSEKSCTWENEIDELNGEMLNGQISALKFVYFLSKFWMDLCENESWHFITE